MASSSSPSSTSVCVIGAGAAGLYAAKILKNMRISSIVVEANDYVGGRLKQLDGFVSRKIDLGAEFIHGSNSMNYRLAEKQGWGINPTFNFDDAQGSIVFAAGGRQWNYEDGPEDFKRALDILDEGDISSGPDMSTADFWRQKGMPKSMWQTMDNWQGKTQAASVEETGLLESSKEDRQFTYGSDNYRLKTSYAPMVKLFAQNLDIRLSWPVASIDYSNPKSIFVTSKSGQTITAEHVIVTVPLPVLVDGDMKFNPPMPQYKVDALAKIGWGAGMKLLLKFKRQWWPRPVSIVIADHPMIGQFWFTDTRDGLKEDECIASAFIMGEQCEMARKLSKQELVQSFLDLLDSSYGTKECPKPASTNLVDSASYDWTDNPFVRGAYSYPKVGASGCREAYSEPIDDVIHFAGEASVTRCSGLVQGAMESGYRAACEIIARRGLPLSRL